MSAVQGADAQLPGFNSFLFHRGLRAIGALQIFAVRVKERSVKLNISLEA